MTKFPICMNSRTRVGLSGADDSSRTARCSRCGRVLKIRPSAPNERGWREATLPRHTSTRDLGGW